MKRIAIVLCLFTIAANAQDAALEQSLATLNAVENVGGQHSATIAAWQVVSKAAPQALPHILGAIDDEKPLGANWIRAAVDHIAERAVHHGRKLPNDALEKVVFDASFSPRARRLGYEWLSRVDDSAEQRIIPKMLNDSSVEMRRDAVSMVLERAAEASGSTEATRKQYRIALASARDTDQIDEAYKKLVELGEKVDLPEHFGFVVNWKVIGPFDNTDKGGFDVVYPPENELSFEKEFRGKKADVTWHDHQSSDKYGMVDLNEAIGKNMGAVAYAQTVFESPTNQEVDLRLGCINASKVWLNGELVMENEVYHSGTKIDQYFAHRKLKAGPNTILLKVCQNEQTENWAQGWQFQFRVCDRVGTAILSQNRP